MKSGKEIPIFSFKPGEVHVWLFDVESADHGYYFWERLLSEEEIDRSKRYIFDQVRLRFITRRGILRQLLSLYTGKDPPEITYFTNPYGKLSLPSHPLSFNISSSQDRIVFAFTMEEEIGVDIEQVRPMPDLSSMIEFCFSPEERAGLSILTPAAQLEAFYHTWTQKEAFLKVRGKGLTLSLQDFSVSVDPNKPGRLLKIKDSNTSLYKMISKVPEPGWWVAVCARTKKKLKIHWHMPNLPDFFSGASFGRVDPK